MQCAGRAKGRKAAIRELDQKTVDDEFVAHDMLTNCRTYPKGEAPVAYKDFNEVLNSVRLAGPASEVARLRARFVIKDSDDSYKHRETENKISVFQRESCRCSFRDNTA